MQVRISRRVKTTVPSVKVTSVDVRHRRREFMSRRGRWVKCTIRSEALSDTGELHENVNKRSAAGIADEAVTQKKSSELPKH